MVYCQYRTPYGDIMTKQVFLATLLVALSAAPVVDSFAGSSSGFSSSKSSSSSSSSKSSSSSSSSKSSTSSSSSPSYKSSGSSSYSYSNSSRSAAPSYSPSNRVTPSVAPSQASRPVTPTPSAPAKTGFSSESASTTKKLAGVAGATALGGALYSAGANHEAATAYAESQKPKAAPAPERTAADTTSHYSRDTRTASTYTPPPAQAPQQVIVVHDRSSSALDTALAIDRAYREGKRDAREQAREAREIARDSREQARYANNTVPNSAVEMTTPSATVVQAPNPSHVSSAAPDDDSHIGFMVFVLVGIILLLFVFSIYKLNYSASGPAKASVAKRKSNYTL